MTKTLKKGSNPFTLTQILIPVLIGIVVIGWLFLSEFDPKSFKGISFNLTSFGFILLAFVYDGTRFRNDLAIPAYDK